MALNCEVGIAAIVASVARLKPATWLAARNTESRFPAKVIPCVWEEKLPLFTVWRVSARMAVGPKRHPIVTLRVSFSARWEIWWMLISGPTQG